MVCVSRLPLPLRSSKRCCGMHVHRARACTSVSPFPLEDAWAHSSFSLLQIGCCGRSCTCFCVNLSLYFSVGKIPSRGVSVCLVQNLLALARRLTWLERCPGTPRLQDPHQGACTNRPMNPHISRTTNRCFSLFSLSKINIFLKKEKKLPSSFPDWLCHSVSPPATQE